MEVVIATEDVGGLAFLLLGAFIYALIVIKDYVNDVRYYRARRIVREREQ